MTMVNSIARPLQVKEDEEEEEDGEEKEEQGAGRILVPAYCNRVPGISHSRTSTA